MLERWTKTVIRRRVSVLATWFVLIVLGVLASLNLNSRLTTSLVVPGSGSSQADAIVSKYFGENSEGTFTVLLKFVNATPQQLAVFKSKIEAAASIVPTSRITQEKALSGYLYASITTNFSLVDAASYTSKLREALIARGMSKALVTGPPAIKNDVSPILAQDLQKGQIWALSLALIILVLVLGFSGAIAVPFIFAGASIAVSLGVVFLLAQHFLMVLYIPNIIELIGLGLAIDYSLLMVHRFRRESLANPESSVEELILTTMKTSGRTIIVSGFTVSIGLATLLLVPVPFVRSLGAAGLIVPLISILTALTLQPVLLSILGRSGTSPRIFPGLLIHRDPTAGIFAKVGHFVIRKPLTVFLASLIILGTVISSIFWLQVTPSSLTAIPKNLESARAISMITDRVGRGVITPSEVIIDLGAPGLATNPANEAARLALSKRLIKDPEVFIVATDKMSPFIDGSGRYLRMFVIGRSDFGSQKAQDLVKSLREVYLPSSNFPKGTEFYLGGAAAQGLDLLDRIFQSFPWIVLLILVLAYVLLLRAFRSIILPLKAILLDLISIAVAYGSMVLVFRFGIGSSVINSYRLDRIEAWVLIFLFAVLFGLSMDYEVFIVSRMRESWDRGESNETSIIDGLVNTGGVVTAAALILISALGGLVFGHFAGLQELGVGLACGVFIDATIIRGLLLPSAMVLLGRWNWWLPESIARLVMAKASPLEERAARL
ncbi:MAG: MMPL family transporter [Actinomycetes bacterium]